MAKSLLKIRAQELRKDGKSIKSIARILKISQSSASLWCRDIRLTAEQVDTLIRSRIENTTIGRLKGAEVQRQKRLKAIEEAKEEARKLNKLDPDRFWIAGLALYLAEGTKKRGQVQFTNSDPRLIRFMLRWFNKFYNIRKDDVRCSIFINEIHKPREEVVKGFWQKYLKLKPERFTSIRYLKTTQKKTYSNHNLYFGTFTFRVFKSAILLYRLNAYSDQLLNLKPL